MKKSDLFSLIVDKVCDVCEINASDLISGCRRQPVVDARVLAVYYLRRIGLTNDDIAITLIRKIAGDDSLRPDVREIKKKAKAIQKTYESYADRCVGSYAFRMIAAEMYSYVKEKFSN